MNDTRISQVLNEHQKGQKQNNNQSKSKNEFQLIFIKPINDANRVLCLCLILV
jgi:hypothetical protein